MKANNPILEECLTDSGKRTSFFCPICSEYFIASKYLCETFEERNVLWFANMVTHYRHEHINFWNKCWSYNGHNYRKKWFGDYEEEKRKVNERCKRQIIRYCHHYMKYYSVSINDIMKLNNTEDKTIQIAKKYLYSGNESLFKNEFDTPLFSN